MRFVASALIVLAACTSVRTAAAFDLPAPGAVSAQTLKLPDGPSSVHGLPSDPTITASSGQLSYQIPIDVPAGIGGSRPSFALSYSGALGNSEVGIGWRVPTIAIRRSERLGVPTFTDADELEIEGAGDGRLVKMSDGSYRVEGQWNQITVVQQNGGFLVTTPDGTRYTLGQTDAGRVEDGARVSAWLVESVTNLTSQTITYSYTHDSGQAYLSSVSWGPSATFGISFSYEARKDAVISYRSGIQVTTARRLTTIQVTAFAEVLRTYQLGYDETLPLSRIGQVTMAGRGSALSLPTVSFTYGSSQAPSMVTTTNTTGWQLNQLGTSFFDVDGDGLPDLMRAQLGAHTYRKNLGGGAFSDPQPLIGAESTELARLRFADIDGDARPELLHEVLGTWRYSRLTSGKWVTTGALLGSLSIPMYDPTTTLLDVNGDGKVDVLRAVTEGLILYQGTGTGFTSGTPLPPLDPTNTVVTFTNPNVRAQDVNGDGLTDYVWLSDAWMKVYLGRGDGTFVPLPNVQYPWTAPVLDGPHTQLSDLNRDGVLDLIRFSDNNVWYYRGRPNLTFDAPQVLQRPESVENDAVMALADVDGNGSDDVVWSSPRGMWALDLAGAATAGMLTHIDNGLGEAITVEYGTTAQLSAQAAAAGTPWTRVVPTSLPVTTRVTRSTGPDEPSRVSRLAVTNGFWDGVERRFGCFLLTREQPESTSAAIVETQYDEGASSRRVLRGEPLVIKTIDPSSGQSILVRHMQRDAVAITGLGTSPLARHGVMLDDAQDHYEGLLQPSTTEIQYRLDGEGRVIEEHDLGRTDLTGDETTKFFTYASDDVTWVRDRVVTRGVEDVAGNVLRMSRTYYGDENGALPLNQIGKGMRIRTESRLMDPVRGEVWHVDDTNIYLANGNVTRAFDGVTWHDRTYDPTGLFVTSERVTTGGTSIAWHADWDRVLALPTAITDPNGNVSYDSYDALGRLVARAHTSGNPYVMYAYDWQAPRPSTTTRLFEGDESTMRPFAAWTAGSGWREAVEVTNGIGEHLYTATRLASDQRIVDNYTVRDELGRTVFRGEPFFAGGSGIPIAMPAGLAGHTLKYDVLGRTVRHVVPSGAAMVSQFSAFQVTTTVDGLAPVTTNLDGLGRPIHTERAAGGSREWVDAAFDATGNITGLRLQGGIVAHGYTYDTLGRLIATSDPDSGNRSLKYNDLSQLIAEVNGAGEQLTYEYDDIGRIAALRTPDNQAFVYHYDFGKDGTSTGMTLGRAAWIEEPSGDVQLAYDQEGRTTRTRRNVSGRSIQEDRRYAPLGLLLGVTYDDGFAYDVGYDDAGRATRIGDFWQAASLDARGAIAKGRFGNGAVETYDRDPEGQPMHLRLERASHAALYDVTVTRNPFGAITSVLDTDGAGLDHTSTFSYDDAGRLAQAGVGGGDRHFDFSYAYDGLQNMTSRTAAGPKSLGIIAGTYIYGEQGASPRQATRVTRAGAADVRMTYDKAGRLTMRAGDSLTYNAFDELVGVKDASGASRASHQYGYDGIRTYTKNADGTEQRWFSADVTEKDGRREHTIELGGRALAKTSTLISDLPAPASGPLTDSSTHPKSTLRRDPRLPFALAFAFAASALALAMVRASRRVRRASPLVALVALVGLLAGCSSSNSPEQTSRALSAWTSSATIYIHQGFAAGPALFTRADGSVEEERTYEPYGAPLDAYRESNGASSIGDVDYRVESRNDLNKDSDPNTGWSYHGARWMAPELGRWLTPDPPTKAPNPKFLLAPWDLNPYSYVRGNPLAFWDPDGENWWSLTKSIASKTATKVVTGLVVGAGTALAIGLLPELIIATTIVSVAVGGTVLAHKAYDAYQRRHEVAAEAHRILSGKMTPNDEEDVSDAVSDVAAVVIDHKLGGVGSKSAAAAAAEEETVRVRHFTNSKGIKGIKNEGVIVASDQNKVFTVRAKGKPGSSKDVEEALRIHQGRGDHYVDFDAKPGEFENVTNKKTGAAEKVFKGDVDLSDRNPTFHKNR